MLQTSDLSFAYSAQTAFRFPNLFCAAGDALLITGGSGKGKTTLLHLLGGLLPPGSGSIHINGTDLVRLSARKLDHFRGQHIGLIYQRSHFVAALSVLDNLLLAPYLSGRKPNKQRAMELLQQLDIAEQAEKRPDQLSLGQQQRVSIARALINLPALILADEPTSSLDDENTQLVADLLKQQAAAVNAALLIVTHDQRLKTQFPHSIQLT